jgi:tetratricopeptide (TPR) repeat protein
MFFTALITAALLAQTPESAPASPAQASGTEELIQEGVQLHDQGDFDAAISRFSAALEADPSNAEAIYELANTYYAVDDFEQCISTARRGVELDALSGDPLYAVLGTCYSANGKPNRALRAFRRGLEKNPDSVPLNFNIAVTLVGLQENRKAIEHLRQTIEAKPDYASPYFVLAKLYEAEHYPEAAIMLYLKFIILEPNTERTAHASSSVFRLFHLGVAETSDEVILNVDPDPPKREGDFSTLQIARTMAASATFIEEEQAKPPSQREVDALHSFLQMSRELTDETLAATFAWKHAATTIFKFQDAELLERLLYLVAARAEIEGAADWLRSNQPKPYDLN